MVKGRILRATAVAATSLGVVAGLTGIAGASSGGGSLSTTGPDSSNQVKTINNLNLDLTNKNKLWFSSDNEQAASSGEANASHNTTAGDAMTGDTSNHSSVSADVSVTNSMPDMSMDSGSGSGGGSIDTTGPDSSNQVLTVNKSDVDVTNTNDISVSTTNEQSAMSGDASVTDNTTAGDATTGGASNTSSSSFTISIQN